MPHQPSGRIAVRDLNRFLWFMLLLAFPSVRPAFSKIPPMSLEEVERCVSIMTKSDDPYRIIMAALSLRRGYGGNTFFTELEPEDLAIDALTAVSQNDPREVVRVAAADALYGRPASQQVRSYLNRQTAEHPDKYLAKILFREIRDIPVDLFGFVDLKRDNDLLIRLLGSHPSAEVRAEAARQLTNAVAWDYAGLLFRLGALDAANPRVKTRAEASLALKHALHNDPSPEVRTAARFGLEQIKPDDLFDDLREAIATDPSDKVRIEAARALTESGNEEARRELSRLAQEDKSPVVRAWALCQLIARFGSRDLTDQCVHLLRESPDADVRIYALGALGAAKENAGDVVACLKKDPSRKVRQTAVWVAVQLLGDGAVPHLGQSLTEDSEEEVREAALSKLVEMKDSNVQPFMAKALQDKSATVRREVLLYLCNPNYPNITPPWESIAKRLKEMALRDADPEVRRRAVMLLLQPPRKLTPQDVKKALSRETYSENSEIRCLLIQQLAGTGAVSYLKNLAVSEKTWKARHAAATLCGQDAIPLLETMAVKDQSPDARWAALLSLKDFRDKETYQASLRRMATQDPSGGCRSSALWMLKYTADETLADLCRSALRRDRDGRVRATASRLLGELGVRAAIDELRSALAREEHCSTRRSILLALGALSATEAVADMVKAARADPDCLCREAALSALASMKAKETEEEATRSLREDSDDLVRREAARALGTVQATGAANSLIKALSHDESVGVRESATKALGDLRIAEAAEPLLKVVELNSPWLQGLRVAAAEALKRVGRPEHVSRLAAVAAREQAGSQVWTAVEEAIEVARQRQ